MMFDSLLMDGMFYVVPFILSVILPAFFIPRLALRVCKVHPETKVLRTFAILLIVGALLGIVIWEKAIFDVLYHEWDRGFLSYSFMYHEVPAVGGDAVLQGAKLQGQGSWILANVGYPGLTFIWFLMTYTIYFLAGLITAALHAKKHPRSKVILVSVGAMCLFSLPFVIGFISAIGFWITSFI